MKVLKCEVVTSWTHGHRKALLCIFGHRDCFVNADIELERD